MNAKPKFYLSKPSLPQLISYPCFILDSNTWDDFGHKTLFHLSFCKNRNSSIEIGTVKILALEDSEDGGWTSLPSSFQKLDKNKFISIGQNIKYYRRLEKLNALKTNMIGDVLKSLCDALLIQDKEDDIFLSHGWEKSLQRSDDAKNAFKYGGYYAGLPFTNITPPQLRLLVEQDSEDSNFEINVSFEKYHQLPNRIFALIGTNGSGKTTILSKIPYLICKGLGKGHKAHGLNIKNLSKSKFSRVIAVSYNQYDSFAIPKASDLDDLFSDEVFNYKYCGVRQLVEDQMAREIRKSGKKEESIKNLLKFISTNISRKDNLFQEALIRKIRDAITIIKRADRDDILEKVMKKMLPEDAVTALFSVDELGERFSSLDKFLEMLSAGQKIMAATIVDLIAFMEQGSLLLIDEPESNLHPGTISTFVAVLQNLLNEFDSFAIIASHSPILLQQVPARYACVLRRNEFGFSAKKLKFETFGEELSTLTERAFGLSEPEQDYRSQIDEWLDKGMSSKEILKMFDDRLGDSAESYIISRVQNEET